MKLGGTALLWAVITVKFFRWMSQTPGERELLGRAPPGGS